MNPSSTFSIVTAPKRNSFHWTPGQITWAEMLEWLKEPAGVKECGNYVMGVLRNPTTVTHPGKNQEPCTDVHRRKDFIVSRSMLTLDVDHPEPGFLEQLEMLFPHAAVAHTTYNSAPDAPRYRLWVPTDRDMAPDEYITAAQHVMGLLGAAQFDPGSSEAERYMFRPSAANREWYSSLVVEGDPLVVDAALAEFEPDLSTKPLPTPHHQKRNPFDIDGVVGAFNKAYADWDLLIEVYELPYEKVDDDRYHLVGARAEAGMGPIREAEGLVYSHHVSDPAYGKACSAFDLVRLHNFGELDEGVSSQTPVNKLPSHSAMLELASGDHRVTAELVGADFSPLTDDDTGESIIPTDWRMQLKLHPKTGKVQDVISNWDLIKKNDPVFGLLYYNEMTFSPEVSDDLPWRRVNKSTQIVTMTDRWEFYFHIERTYGVRAAKALVDSFIDTAAAQNMLHPVERYLNGLEWDGIARIETSLPGVRPTSYTRLVARKTFIAAVARVFDPGCKWDHTLVLQGDEGLGKSWWIEKVANGWAAALGDITNKDTLLAMQRSWIMVSDEGHSLKKVDADVMKEFLTKTEDVFRMPYDRETLPHPRRCVIWSSTNDETFLRRQQGNRRFLPVNCEDKVDFNAVTQTYVDQLWAEAVYHYRAGEVLYLDMTEAQAAANERERYVEEDALAGIIHEYLNTLVPEDWWDRTLESRQEWMRDRSSGFVTPGTKKIDRVCSTQVWVEALGRRVGDHRRIDLLDITNAIKRLDDWVSLPGRHRVPGYGPQQIFIREEDNVL